MNLYMCGTLDTLNCRPKDLVRLRSAVPKFTADLTKDNLFSYLFTCRAKDNILAEIWIFIRQLGCFRHLILLQKYMSEDTAMQ